MKRNSKIAALCATAVVATGVVTAMVGSAATAVAKPSTHKIYLDGERVSIAAYEINGNNYFKIRDVAAILSGTNAQFDVTWDAATGNITLTDDKAYTKTGDELYAIPSTNQTAEDSTAPLYRDGERVNYTGYNVNDNNYYKLRDIAEDFDFGVTWEGETQSVYIETDEEYVPEGQEPTVEPEDPDPVVDPDEPEPTDPSTPEEPEQTDPSTPEYSMTSPAVGEYSDYYQDYLDNCGEEIVTCNIKYVTYDGRTTEKGTYGGFKASVWTYPTVSYLNDGSPFDDNYPIYTIWVDESGRGSFQLKMPKSLYEDTMDGNIYMFLSSSEASNQVEINGKLEYVAGTYITDAEIREINPRTILITIG